MVRKVYYCPKCNLEHKKLSVIGLKHQLFENSILKVEFGPNTMSMTSFVKMVEPNNPCKYPHTLIDTPEKFKAFIKKNPMFASARRVRIVTLRINQ
jgi:hypothetical protein